MISLFYQNDRGISLLWQVKYLQLTFDWQTSGARLVANVFFPLFAGRSRGAIISQYYNRTMQLRRHRQSRPSIRDFSRSSRPSIRGYGGVESDGGDLNEEGEDHSNFVFLDVFFL